MAKTSDYIRLESELESYKEVMSRAADHIMDQHVSKYPIFVVHKGELSLGLSLVDRANAQGDWSIHASTLEEFSTKQIIESAKLDSFRTIYKNPKTHLCLFVLSELGAQFIFLPRKHKPEE